MTVSGITTFRGKVRLQETFTGSTRLSVPTIAYVGDNLTYGTGGSVPYGTRVAPNQWNGLTPAQFTFAAPGYTIPMLFNTSENSAQNQRTGATLLAPGFLHRNYAADVGLNIAVIWAGTNDIAQGVPVGTVYGRLAAFASNIRSRGWSTIVLTMISRNGFDVQKNALNSKIRAGWTSFAGGLADVAANPNLGADGAFANLTYFSTDGINLNDTGYTQVASTVQVALNNMIAGSTVGFASINDIAAAIVFGG